jgi:Helix-hairpin-helix domain
MSNFSRSVPKGGGKDGEKPDAPAAAPAVPPPLPPAAQSDGGAPPIVVSRVVNVSWERQQQKTQPILQVPRLDPRVELEEEEPTTEPGTNFSPASTRPSVLDRQSLFEVTGSGSIADTFEKLLGEVDEQFAAIQEDAPADRPPSSHKSGPPLAESDLADVRELFAQLAAKHMRQVRDFMIDLKWGEAPHSWIALSEPAVRSLRGAAERLGLAELCESLDGFGAALDVAQKVTSTTVTGEHRDRLLDTYAKLVEVMPQAFALDLDRTQRESVIVHSLLLQIPGVGKLVVDKLYAAGLQSLDTLFSATAADIVQTTGIAQSLADRVVGRFQLYRKELHAAQPDATRAQERSRLDVLVKRLRHQHEGFEKLTESWAPGAAGEKKTLRQSREATLLDCNVVLARLGEVDRLHEIEKMPFGKKVDALEVYLEEAARAYTPGK